MCEVCDGARQPEPCLMRAQARSLVQHTEAKMLMPIEIRATTMLSPRNKQTDRC